jgi:hypothetical protein
LTVDYWVDVKQQSLTRYKNIAYVTGVVFARNVW